MARLKPWETAVEDRTVIDIQLIRLSYVSESKANRAS